MSWIMGNIKLLAIAGAAAAMFAAGWYVEGQIAEGRLKKALEAQEVALHEECQKDKAITKGVADDFQNKNAALNRRIGQLKRLHASAACVVPAPGPAVGGNAGAGGAVPAGQDGITTDSLFDFAGEAEKYRLQLISCQDFINQTWKAKGQ